MLRSPDFDGVDFRLAPNGTDTPTSRATTRDVIMQRDTLKALGAVAGSSVIAYGIL